MFITRPLARTYFDYEQVPHIMNQDKQQRMAIARASGGGMCLPFGYEPMMETGPNRFIPAAQDPTDPRTWRVPVVFT